MDTDAIDSETFRDGLQWQRHKNAHRVNLLRFRAVSLFFAVNGVFAIFQESPGSLSRVPPLTCYWLVAIALWLASTKYERVARLAGFSIPFLDMPMVFWVQSSAFETTSSTVALAEFTVGIYVVLVVLAMLALERWEILLSAAVGSGLALVLETKAGSEPIAKISTVLLIGATATAGLYARHRLLELLHNVAGAHLRRRRLGRYFSPQVAAIIEDQVDEATTGQRLEITVLFCDIREFTRVSDAMDPQAVVRLLDEYHARMTEELFAHGGTLDKYLGDGLMAYFGAPMPQPDHATRAVRCALAMHEALDQLNADRRKRNEPALRMGIGIHTGTAIVGSIGTPKRREYTAIGSTVNIAARLQQLTKEYRVPSLVSHSTFQKVGSRIRFHPIASVQARGCSQPLQIHTPEQEEQESPG